MEKPDSGDPEPADDPACWLCGARPPDNPTVLTVEDDFHVTCTACRDDFVCGCGG